MMKTKTILIVGGAICLVALATSAHGFGWSLVNAKIRHDFPGVKRITTDELAAWLADKQRPAPLLLDVRTAAEYDVSHLQNAERIAPDAPASAVEQPKDRAIVTYCSVGYRSGGLAKKLRDAGFTKVSNLEGSIFVWANEGRPIFRDGQKVSKVHPYNRVWGLLLDKKYRADISSAEKEKE
ncbi:MAG: rhodanese-like domain-containing protein [Chthoniobacterales bacterium]